jgi:hypothetical protein
MKGRLMKVLPKLVLAVASTSVVVAFATARPARAQSPAANPAHGIVGVWTLNQDLSDKPPSGSQNGDQGDHSGGQSQGGSRGYGGHHGGRGGSGGGGFGGGGGGARSGMSPEDQQRMRAAMHDIMNPPERLTITEGSSMVIVTSGDGHVVRLSPDGKPVKDDATKISRKTKWDGDKLVSEISGVAPRKVTETYLFDAEHKQLHVTVQVDNPSRPVTVNRVYDAG